MFKVLLFISLVIAGAFCADKAELIVQKSILTAHTFVEDDLVVTFKIFNVGTSSAYDIKLDDATNWPAESFDLKVGLPTASWGGLAPGANITHAFVVVPHTTGAFQHAPATVTYRQSATGNTEVVSSTPGGLVVEEVDEFYRRQSANLKEWGIFTLLVLGSMALPFAVFQYYQTNSVLTKKEK